MASKKHRPEGGCSQAAAGRRPGLAGAVRGRGDPGDWGDGADLVSLATGVRGLEVGSGERLKDLEAENARLRKAIADLTLDKQILAEAARGNY